RRIRMPGHVDVQVYQVQGDVGAGHAPRPSHRRAHGSVNRRSPPRIERAVGAPEPRGAVPPDMPCRGRCGAVTGGRIDAGSRAPRVAMLVETRRRSTPWQPHDRPHARRPVRRRPRPARLRRPAAPPQRRGAQRARRMGAAAARSGGPGRARPRALFQRRLAPPARAQRHRGDAHAAWRRALDGFLTAEALAPFHDRFRQVARDLVASLPAGTAVDAVSAIGVRFAVRAQCTWLGWPASLEDRLVDWVVENHAATRSRDRDWTRRVAESFDAIILSVLEPRRDAARRPASDADDLTTRLMRSTVDGRPLVDAELVSILRNWTGGDLGSIAQCVGVLVHHLATRPALQARLRA